MDVKGGTAEFATVLLLQVPRSTPHHVPTPVPQVQPCKILNLFYRIIRSQSRSRLSGRMASVKLCDAVRPLRSKGPGPPAAGSPVGRPFSAATTAMAIGWLKKAAPPRVTPPAQVVWRPNPLSSVQNNSEGPYKTQIQKDLHRLRHRAFLLSPLPIHAALSKTSPQYHLLTSISELDFQRAQPPTRK